MNLSLHFLFFVEILLGLIKETHGFFEFLAIEVNLI